MKNVTALVVLALIGTSTSALAQNAQLPGGATNAPPGTTSNNSGTSALPESTTNTPRPGALDATNVTAGQAAAQSKFKDAGFSDVKGLSRSTDGTWSGRGVKNGVEVGVMMDASGNITTH
jgi:hypothetical protein